MWFGDQIIDYPPSGSSFGLVVRPLGAGASGSQVVTGSILVSNFPAVQQITGTLALSGPITGTVGISAPVTVIQASGNWNVKTDGSIVDANNSTTGTLAAYASFTGSATDCLGYNQVHIGVVTSHSGTVRMQFSPDQINWDHEILERISGTPATDISSSPHARYFRVIYENGVTQQTFMRLQTIIRPIGAVATAVPADYTPLEHSSVNLTKSILTGRNSLNRAVPTFVDVQATPAGSIQVALTDKEGDFVGVDAFSRMRVGMPHTLADLIMKYEIDTRDWGTQGITGGTVVHVPSGSCARLSVTAASGSQAVLQTHTYFRYQAGKSQQIRQTCAHADSGQAGQIRKWGYFDNNDGIFFQLSGSSLGIVQRSSRSGVVVDTVISQSAWNVDKLDGSGVSGFNLDLTKGNIYEVEFQWLGVGDVRLSVSGHECHFITNTNQHTGVYMRTAQLPARAEVTNYLASTTSYLDYICTSIESHAGTDPPRETFGVRNALDIVVSTTEIPLLIIRPKLVYPALGITNRMMILPKIVAANTDSGAARYSVYMNPTTITGGAWVSVDARSGTEYNVTATAFTGGQLLFDFLLPNAADAHSQDISLFFDFDGRRLRLDAFGTIQDTLLITGQKIKAGNTNMRSSISWDESR